MCLRICAVSPEPLYRTRQRFRPRIRQLAPLDGRGEMIHQIYHGASRFSGHDSVRDSFFPNIDTVLFGSQV